VGAFVGVARIQSLSLRALEDGVVDRRWPTWRPSHDGLHPQETIQGWRDTAGHPGGWTSHDRLLYLRVAIPTTDSSP
jgi:hypothetical protein